MVPRLGTMWRMKTTKGRTKWLVSPAVFLLDNMLLWSLQQTAPPAVPFLKRNMFTGLLNHFRYSPASPASCSLAIAH